MSRILPESSKPLEHLQIIPQGLADPSTHAQGQCGGPIQVAQGKYFWQMLPTPAFLGDLLWGREARGLKEWQH